MNGGNISDINRIVDILKDSATELYFYMQDIVDIQMLSKEIKHYSDVPTETEASISIDSEMDASIRAHNSLLFLNGYTNGCTGYLPTKEEWIKGGFETLYSYFIFFQYHGHAMPFRENAADNIVELVTNTWSKLNLQ